MPRGTIRTTIVLVSSALVLGGCALTTRIPTGSAGDSSSYGIGSGKVSASDIGGTPSSTQRLDKFQAP
jgi:hypothetical protein